MPFKGEDLDEVLRKGYLKLIRKKEGPYLVSYTVNCVLQGKDQTGATTYKVHYGADYAPGNDRLNFTFFINDDSKKSKINFFPITELFGCLRP